MNHNLQKLSSVGFFDIKPGLERINKVLTFLDNPQDKTSSVLIAGTNGKGSVAAILSSILVSNGYNTGLYTSPHLLSVTERIKINSRNITEHELDKTLGMVFNACEHTNTILSYFELVTAAAFVYFEQKKIDIGILEVGMGGRWDATNVVNPLVSVITNISFDHTEHLGNTLELIAAEKAEIIKNNAPVVSGVTGEGVKIIMDKAQSEKSEIFLADTDFHSVLNNNGSYNYNGMEIKLKNLKVNLLGKHQIINSSLAIAVSEILNKKDEFKIDFKSIKTPLGSVDYEGRFEILRTEPYLILDAAHNTSAAKALINTFSDLKQDKIVFLVGMLSDKNHEEFMSILSDKAEKIVVTYIPNERGVEPNHLYKISKKYLNDAEIIEDYKEAYEYVKTLNKNVCITGSVYLVGLIKEYINK